MSRRYTIRPWEIGKVSPQAARLSSVAYILGYVCLAVILIWAGGVPLFYVLGLLPGEQSSRVQVILFFLMLVTSLPTIAIAIAIVALVQLRKVSASVVHKDRAGQAMVMGFITLSIPLGLLFLALGHL